MQVRPMSLSERERGCGVAYVRNHETSLTYFQPDVKPPEDKKSFEFDKVEQHLFSSC